MSDFANGPAAVMARIAAMGAVEDSRAEFRRQAAAVDAQTWANAGVDQAFICARAQAVGEIEDRRAAAQRQREWATAGDGSTVLESDAQRSARLEADERGVLERARARWPRVERLSAEDDAMLTRVRARSEQARLRAQSARYR
jgi:hypothetical protein